MRMPTNPTIRSATGRRGGGSGRFWLFTYIANPSVPRLLYRTFGLFRYRRATLDVLANGGMIPSPQVPKHHGFAFAKRTGEKKPALDRCTVFLFGKIPSNFTNPAVEIFLKRLSVLRRKQTTRLLFALSFSSWCRKIPTLPAWRGRHQET